jgi:hypothetical protein
MICALPHSSADRFTGTHIIRRCFFTTRIDSTEAPLCSSCERSRFDTTIRCAALLDSPAPEVAPSDGPRTTRPTSTCAPDRVPLLLPSLELSPVPPIYHYCKTTKTEANCLEQACSPLKCSRFQGTGTCKSDSTVSMPISVPHSLT